MFLLRLKKERSFNNNVSDIVVNRKTNVMLIEIEGLFLW